MNIYEPYKKLLSEFIAFKSISTDDAFASESKAAVAWLSKLLKKGKFEVKIIEGKQSNPLIIARLDHNKSLPTVMIYGHYDVQPAEQKDGWSSDPFVLTESKGKLIARGVVDNKGQILAHIVSVMDAKKKKVLQYNVVFLIEGNEESGNPDLPKQLKKYKKDLECDYVIISDGEIAGNNPVLEASLRGGGNIKVQYTTAKSDQHSGIFGGAIPSAPLELMKTLSLMKKNNKVTIPGFYEDAPNITKSQKENNEQLSSEKTFQRIAGVKSLVCEKGLHPYSQVGLRPTIEITGFNSGYTGVGFKNIVPAYAEARINVRTVAPQDSSKVLKNISEHIKRSAPEYVSVKVEVSDPYPAVALDVNSPLAEFLKKKLAKSYGKDTRIKYVGGGIPVVSYLTDILKKRVFLVSLGNDDCNMHGIDENYSIKHIEKALMFCEDFWGSK